MDFFSNSIFLSDMCTCSVYSSNNLEVQFTQLDGKKNLLIDPKLTKLFKDDAAIVYKLLQKLVIFKVNTFILY